MNILIIHQGALGDFILSLPAIGAIRNSHPGSAIEIWGYPDILRLVEGRFYADAIASIHQEGMSHLYRGQASAPDRLMERFRSFDLVVLFGGELQGTVAENLRRHGVRSVYRISSFPGDDGSTHVIDHQLAQLSTLGVQSAGSVPVLFPDREDERYAQQFFDAQAIEPDAFTVAVHIGSGSRKKVWPPDRFAQLAETLVTRRGARIILVAGPADETAGRHYRACTPVGQSSILNCHPLPELAAIIGRCSVLVGNDSGVTHLAAAAGTPVVALFGPTDPRVWGPRGKEVVLLRRSAECSPCSREKMHSCAHQKCLEHISVEEVYEAVVQGR
jgi:ADP-heptose:LPS heptosyltransferase